MSTKKSFWLGLPMQMMYGLVLGVVVGTMVSSESVLLTCSRWHAFIRLIRMVVVPLVVATLIAGSAGLGNASKIGKIAVKTILFFAVTTAIAVTIGLIVANIMEPGTGLTISVEGLKAKAAAAPALSKVLLDIVPINPIEAFAKGNMLQVIFFSIFFGFCLSLMGESVRMVTDFFQMVGDVMIRMTNYVMLYAPIGVFGLIAYTVTRHGLSVLLPLGKLILTAFIATVIFVVVTYPADHQTHRHEDLRLPQRRIQTLAYRFHNLLFRCSSCVTLKPPARWVPLKRLLPSQFLWAIPLT